jgi:hypothetical protein
VKICGVDVSDHGGSWLHFIEDFGVFMSAVVTGSPGERMYKKCKKGIESGIQVDSTIQFVPERK